MSQVQQTYAALSWSAVAFLGTFLVGYLVRGRAGNDSQYWAFIFRAALIAGVLTGLGDLILKVGFVWSW